MFARHQDLSELPRVLCLAGPTGSGKTALAAAIARKLNCEIVNADSRQIYGDFPIITAQPSPEELGICRHHLYGFLDATQKLGAGQWAVAASRICRDIIARGKRPLLVGGTGFYFEAALNGLAAMPEVPEDVANRIAVKMEAAGPQSLHEELSGLDPFYAAKIHPHDRQRIQRALEIFYSTGLTFTWWHENSRRNPCLSGTLLVIGMSLGELEPRLACRIEQMLALGAVEETQAAFRKCPDTDMPGWSAIGAAETLAFIQGRLSSGDCRRLWLANTRAYAKRQLTWFRSRKNAVWIEPSNPHLADEIVARYGW